MNIAELIKIYCQDHGITYQQFAKDSGTSKAYISMLVNGRNPKTGKPLRPTIETYMALASAMGMTLDQLFDTIDDAPVSLLPPTRDEDEELWQIREDFRRNPELRTIHSLTRNATRQELRQVEAFIRAIRSSNEEDTD